MRREILVWTALVAVAVLIMSLVLGLSAADAQSSGDDPGQVTKGQAVFASSCAACHGEDGGGTERGRPLTDIASQGERAHHIVSVTDGKGNMPGFGERLGAEEIEAALSYVRLTFVTDAEADSSDAEMADDSGAAADEPAETTALALTGSETPVLAIAGLGLIAAGALLTQSARRHRT